MSGSDNLLAFLLVTIRVYRGLIGEARYGMLAIAWLRLRYLTLLYRRLRKTDLTSFSGPLFPLKGSPGRPRRREPGTEQGELPI
jgi:hypothetical protein